MAVSPGCYGGEDICAEDGKSNSKLEKISH
jgi:hypothetical protein